MSKNDENKKSEENEKKKKLKQEKKAEKQKNKKPSKVKEKLSKASYTFKKKFMTNDVRTILIILILIAVFIGGNLWVKSINFAQLDFSEEKLYTLSDTSKEVAKSIDKDILIYVWGYEESSNQIGYLKQYNAANSRITYKIIDATEDTDLVSEYALEADYPVFIVTTTDEDGDVTKTDYIYSSDLYTYDSSFNQIDITEQTFTNSILKIASDYTPKVYFLTGNEVSTTSYSLIESFKYYIAYYGLYESYELSTTNAKDFEVPEDCDTLVITTLTDDLNSSVSDAIIEYIDNGGNILIMNNNFSTTGSEFENYQSILDLYGVSFNDDYVIENGDYAVSGTNSAYIYPIWSSSSEITRSLTTTPVLCLPGSINIDADSVSELEVTYDAFLYSSDDSYSLSTDQSTILDANGSYIIGASFEKLVSDGVYSNAVVFSTQASFSDLYATDLGYSEYPLYLFTEELASNAIAYLTDSGEYYSLGKLNSSTISTSLVLSENQDYIVKLIITSVPVIIIVAGFVVSRLRKSKFQRMKDKKVKNKEKRKKSKKEK